MDREAVCSLYRLPPDKEFRTGRGTVMSRYTYTLHPSQTEPEKETYRQSELEKMTTFHLREICRKERLVVPSSSSPDREALIRILMRFRGRKEFRHIQTGAEGGLERLEACLRDHGVKLSHSQVIRIPGTIVLYEAVGLSELDGYQVQSEGALYEGNLLLVDEDLRVYTCFYIRQEQSGAWLSKGKDVPVRPLEKHQYSLLYFPHERDSEFLYDCYHGNRTSVPGYLEGIQIPLLDIREKKVETADLPLVIDFGSSNTTMGICLPDGSSRTASTGGTPVIPSVIGVRVTEGERTEFLFGEEALALTRQNYRDEDVAVFHDIKRWVSDAERSEGVILQNGYRYQFRRKEMLRAYLDYLLDLARQQFKCSFTQIQLLSPIRQKEKFQELFRELLPEYTVNCELDEGMAVLYHSISRMIQNRQYEDGYWYHALVIDCGGGTTDLTSGRFRIDNNRVSYIVDLETQYENGDTNFGGNNLTYRIFQLLKIRIAEELGFLQKEEGGGREDAALREALERRYGMAETWIPTRFKDYEERTREQYFFVKNNYYYLFELAEQVKKAFFQPRFLYELRISTRRTGDEKEAGTGAGKELFLDKWKLSLCQDGSFGQVTGQVEFCLYLNEIEELLRPDVYRLMEKFLDSKFSQGELSRYEMIKMTGQSCKSPLFTEALKEYVPGKMIQNTRKDSGGNGLKMCCLEGALAYFRNCKLGYMRVNQNCQEGRLPYEIMAHTHEGEEKILVKSLDPENRIGCISRFRIGRQLDLYLNDGQGNRLKTCYYEYDTSQFKKTTQEEIDRAYHGTVIQAETDTIVEGEMKFFVWVSKKRWGFVVLPVLRDGEQLYTSEETFFDFEDDTWELNFFDGRK